MIVDVGKSEHWKGEWLGTKCFLDGKEIRCVYYADTEKGIIKTFDVLHGGSEHTPSLGYTAADFPGRNVSCAAGDVLRETLTGVVTLQFPPGVTP